MKNFIPFWNRSYVFKLSGLGVDEASSATERAMLKKIIVITIKKHDHVAWFYQIHIAVWIRISVKIYVTVKMNFSGPHKNKLKHYSSKIFCLVHIWSGSFDLEIGAVHGMLFLLVLYLMLLEQNNFLWLRPQSYWGKGSNEDSHAEPGWACHCYSCYLHWRIIGRWSPWRNRRCCNFSRIHDWKVVP